MAFLLISATAVVSLNLAADLTARAIDPRIDGS
jgi:ABC-type dipeptide/oligopeptide/nickel transport system permease component